MTPYNINNWYWSVGDQSPSTQVYSTASNSFVPLANTTYSNWLAAGNHATVIDTMANLYDVFNTHNFTSYVPSTQNYGTLGASLSVTNPLPATINVGFSATLCQVILPRMDTPNGIPIGKAFTIANTGSIQFGVMVNGGVTNLAVVQPNGLIILQLNANNSQGGTVQVLAGSTAGTSDITVGTTHINAGHSGNYLYDAAGFVGEQTIAQLQANLNYFTPTVQGVAPPSGGGTLNFLRADGNWVAPPGPNAMTVGSTTIAGGSPGNTLFDNGGILGERTLAQLTAVLNPFSATLQGVVIASGGGTTNFLRADGTWAAPTVAASGLVVGTSTVTGGTTLRVLYDNAGIVGEYTNVQLTALIQPFTTALSGVAPASGGGTVNYLRADGTWASPPGSGSTAIVVGSTTIAGGTTGNYPYDNGGLFGEKTPVQVTADLSVFTSALKGLAPASGGGTVNYLRADGTWASPAPAGAALTAVSDTNVTLATSGTPATALLVAAGLTVGWTGTLAATRLNANVVQAVTNDTNINGSISAQNLTFSWAGVLAAGRGGTGSAFFNVAGPTALRTYTFPDASVSLAALNLANQTVTGGASVASFGLGTAGGTVTANPGGCPLQYITNNAAFTLAAPTADGSMMLLVTNGASAGAITMSGFTVGANTGDAYDQVSGHKFTFSIWRINGTSGYRVAAHQ